MEEQTDSNMIRRRQTDQQASNEEDTSKEEPPNADSKKNNAKPLHFGHPSLSPWEHRTYWSIWLLVNICLFYRTYLLSQRSKPKLKRYIYKHGWLTHWKDDTDFEWSFWRRYLVLLSLLYCVHSLLFYIVKRMVPYQWMACTMGVISILLVSPVLSVTGTLLILLHAVFFFAVVKVTARKGKFFIWVFWVATVAFVNIPEYRDQLYKTISLDTDCWDFVLFATLICHLRFISYGCYIADTSKSSEEHESSVTFSGFFFYVMYVPVFFEGPAITYDTFMSGLNRHDSDNISTGEKYVGIVKDLIKCLVQALLLEIFLHFFYANAISFDEDLLRTLSPLESCGVCWILLNIFCVKYYIFYRFNGLFAKIDGIEPPGPPKCIASLYTFVDMWRYFDKGLHRLLQQCIYHPMGGSRRGLLRQFLASFLCFAFVGFWHGNTRLYMYWAITNWLGIVTESLVGCITRTTAFERFRRRYIGAVAFRRLCALCGSFAVFALVYTNMVFLVDIAPANILLGRLFSTWYAPLLTLTVYYILNNCSIDVN